jgi:hypothetical protein
MDRRTVRRWLRRLAPVALVLTAAGCGGGGGSPTSGGPGAPTIANLVATFLAQDCTTPGGQPGTVLSARLSYTDPDGDVQGGTINTRGSFNPSMSVGFQTFLIPADTFSITGTTSGSIELRPCVRFGSDTTFTVDVTLIDAAGHASNALTATLSKPSGAP